MKKSLPAIQDMIGALIALPSVSCTDPSRDLGNLEVIDLLADWAESIGFQVEIDRFLPNKANLIATLGTFSSKETPGGLILSGHTDTVPCDPELWASDPFLANVRDDRIYGLGSADMKSFMALALSASCQFKDQPLREPLVLLATADEESSMSGARALLARNQKLGRHAVIGEPTGLKPIRMHKGVAMASITIHGQSGHSSDPELGANAIDGMHAVLSELIAIRHEMRAQHWSPHFRVGHPTLNLGSIHGGDNPNRICGHCQTQIDIRPLPGMDVAALMSELGERLAQVIENFPGLRLEISRLSDGIPAFETSAESEIVKTAEQLTASASGSVAFGTEAPFLKALGSDTIVMGPGHIDQAHQPNEYLPLDHIAPCISILEKLIGKFCL